MYRQILIENCTNNTKNEHNNGIKNENIEEDERDEFVDVVEDEHNALRLGELFGEFRKLINL